MKRKTRHCDGFATIRPFLITGFRIKAFLLEDSEGGRRRKLMLVIAFGVVPVLR